MQNVGPLNFPLTRFSSFQMPWQIPTCKTFTLTYPLTAGVTGEPQMTSQPVSFFPLCSPLPSETWRTPGLSILLCCLPTSFSVCLFFFPLLTVPCKMILARPDEWETCPYHFSLCLLTTTRSSCGPTACWILAQTSSFMVFVWDA